MTALPLDAVQVIDRHRHDLGNIAGLAESMTEVGQLQPIVVTPEHRLVAGERRLAAARSLGWTEIDAVVVTNLTDAASLLQAEHDENECRLGFSPSEGARLRKAREALLKPLKPKGRPRKGAKLADFPGEVRKVAAVGTGYSGSTLDKVDEVQAIATDPATPEPVRAAAKQAIARQGTAPQQEPLNAIEAAPRNGNGLAGSQTHRV